jgi:hypothetical protein
MTVSVGYAGSTSICNSGNTAGGIFSIVCRIWQYDSSHVDGIRMGSSTVGSAATSAAVQTAAFGADPTISQTLTLLVNANAADTYTPQWFWVEVVN